MDNKKLLLSVAAIQSVQEVLETSSDSSSDDANENRPEHFLVACCIRESHPRQTGYLQVVSSYSDRDFWRHFRVSRATFHNILDFMRDESFRSNVVYRGGFEPMENSEMLLICLQYLGNQGAIRLWADKFDRTESTVFNCIRIVCEFLFQKQSHFIRWPSIAEVRGVAEQFRRRSGFPGVVGALDGYHIPFQPTSGSSKPYRNYKKFHSFVLMATVLPDRSFSYIFTGFPGSAHDSTIFQRSSLFEKLENNCINHFNPNRYHIIADSAFPLKSWLLPPYKQPAGGLSQSQKRFNFKHSQTRIVVENAFGDLKNRFRRCQMINATIENGVNIAVASCVIHNICIQNGDIVIEDRNPPRLHCNVNPNPHRLDNLRNPGHHKRDFIRAGFDPVRNIAFNRR